MTMTGLPNDGASIESFRVANKVMVIAEIGINHNGDLDITRQLIDMAKVAGCDAVKFQKRTIDIVYPADVLDSPRESPWGNTQRAQKEGLEFGSAEYDAIDTYCREIGMPWFASAWDISSQEFLRPYKCPYNKIASAMMTNTPFLEVVAAEGRPTFVSTGMCEWADVDRAVDIFKAAKCPFVLMHTVSTYPTPENDLNVMMIATLRQRYGCDVGYSGHEASVSPSIIAATLGAVAVERHITLDRAMYGSDQAASLEPSGLNQLVSVLRKIPVILGDGKKSYANGEQAVADKLRYWTAENVSD